MRVLRYGTRALLVECADQPEAAALYAELLRRRAEAVLPPIADIVPAERTVLLDGVAPQHADRLASEIPAWQLPAEPAPSGRVVELPVRYDGPDRAHVAEAWHVSVDELAGIHAACVYRVAFCGFAPGFAYLTGLPEPYHLPRRSTPRAAVPPGSVAVAGPYTGVYPRTSPGGWHLIGTTDAQLWNLARPEPALLTPGTTVRFVPRGE
jgi:KipI family sensor histidine kinase inhibitor